MFDFGTIWSTRRLLGRLTVVVLAVAIGVIVLSSTAPARPRDAAYNADLIRLSEVLGAIHYLRALCRTNEGQLWRNKMTEMLETEEPDEDQRQLLVSHFNITYHRYRKAYERCTTQAVSDANQFIEEGEQLSDRLAVSGAP